MTQRNTVILKESSPLLRYVGLSWSLFLIEYLYLGGMCHGLVLKNGHQKNTCHIEIGLHAQYWEGLCGHLKRKNLPLWTHLTSASQLWLWNLKRQSSWFNIAKRMRQFPTRSNSHNCLEFEVPTMGPYTLIATTLLAQIWFPWRRCTSWTKGVFLKVRNVYLGNNTISNLVARVERLVVLHKPPWMACGIQDDSCFNQSAVFTCNKWFWWIMVYSLDLHNPHKLMSLDEHLPLPFQGWPLPQTF